MRIIALTVGADGIIRADRIPPNKRIIELPDGAHPLMADAIYYDIDNKGPPIVIYWHGFPAPEGHPLNEEQEAAYLKETLSLVQHRFRPVVSRLWSRRFMQWGLMFLKVMLFAMLFAFSMIILVLVLT